MYLRTRFFKMNRNSIQIPCTVVSLTPLIKEKKKEKIEKLLKKPLQKVVKQKTNKNPLKLKLNTKRNR